jgi:hypothetical protein
VSFVLFVEPDEVLGFGVVETRNLGDEKTGGVEVPDRPLWAIRGVNDERNTAELGGVNVLFFGGNFDGKVSPFFKADEGR